MAILLAFPSSTSTAKLAEIGISSSVFAILKKIKSDPIKRESGHLRILIPLRHFHTAMETRFDKLLNLSTNYRQKTFKKGLIWYKTVTCVIIKLHKIFILIDPIYIYQINIVSKTVPSNDGFSFFLLCALLVQQHFVTLMSTEILTWLWIDFNRRN